MYQILIRAVVGCLGTFILQYFGFIEFSAWYYVIYVVATVVSILTVKWFKRLRYSR